MQRIAPAAPASGVTGAAAPSGGATAKEDSSAAASKPGAGGAETVTAKHVEAELNRLEAELK